MADSFNFDEKIWSARGYVEISDVRVRREHFVTCCAYDRKILGIADLDFDEVEILDLVTVVNPVVPEIATADDRLDVSGGQFDLAVDFLAMRCLVTNDARSPGDLGHG
ncbi:hypothetical protein [Saccharopolyspora spinosa]|uniref:Uncharacterized protein n=1 Tax=Saccharopolyspora spinosa TaxID=60894 RepID=A0A2N3Y5B5_SACSN|nr:hypothetical protein [Saccharopolyspora spinosa]PKW18117.1 hypothetical protein A8926_6178 [Saccharopolyspora spinosa]